nr:ORF3 [Teosinte-associated betaflexivirus]
MSIERRIQENRRTLVSEIVVQFVMGGRAVPEGDRIDVCNGIIKDVFGNIAYYQASESTIFPDVRKQVTIICDREEGDDVTHNFEYNLNRLTNVLRSAPVVSQEPLIKGATFRQLCIPFAEMAKVSLREQYTLDGTVSALALTLPKICERAPWVAFDFNRGLNYRLLTSAERSVIQNLNRRLLSTTLKVNIGEAQADGATSDVAA